MRTVRFAWSPALVEIRRETCPRAKWLKVQRAWMMSAADAEAFLAASHARLDFARRHGEIDIDGERWIVGFVQGAPYKETPRI